MSRYTVKDLIDQLNEVPDPENTYPYLYLTDEEGDVEYVPLKGATRVVNMVREWEDEQEVILFV